MIADEHLDEIKRVHLQAYENVSFSPGGVDLDIHDFILLDDDHYLTMCYYARNPKNIPPELNPHPKVTVLAPLIQEVDHGSIFGNGMERIILSFTPPA